MSDSGIHHPTPIDEMIDEFAHADELLDRRIIGDLTRNARKWEAKEKARAALAERLASQTALRGECGETHHARRETLRAKCAALAAVHDGRTGLLLKRLEAGPELVYSTFDCEFKAASTDDPDEFRMYGCVWNNVDRQGDIVAPGAIANTSEFLSDGWIAGNHNNTSPPVAFPVAAESDARGFLVTARWHTTPEARAYRTITRERRSAGKSVQCSIGYRILDAAQETRNGERIRVLKSIAVYECSITNLAANPLAQVV